MMVRVPKSLFGQEKSMRAGSLQSISALLFVSAILSAPIAAQNATDPAPSGNDAATAPADNSTTPLRRIGGGVTPPKPQHLVDPQFSEQARAAKVGGVVLVTLIVDANGMPQNVHVLRGVGMGLDEKAVEAVKQYKFLPAMEGGKPVPVQLNVEVNFQIFDGPKVLHSVPLELSDEARQAHASGAILVAFTVDTHGNAQNVHVLHGVGLNMDERAVQAIHQYKFEPFVEDGQPVAKATTLQLKFDAK
jgi:TonB family protein